MVVFVALLILYTVILCTVLASALFLGGRTERAFAIVIAIGFITTQLVALVGVHWTAPEYVAWANDAALTIAMGWVTVRSRKFWPIWATGSQLNATITHLASLPSFGLRSTSYFLSQTVWVIPLLLALVLGTARHARSVRAQQRTMQSRLMR